MRFGCWHLGKAKQPCGNDLPSAMSRTLFIIKRKVWVGEGNYASRTKSRCSALNYFVSCSLSSDLQINIAIFRRVFVFDRIESVDAIIEQNLCIFLA